MYAEEKKLPDTDFLWSWRLASVEIDGVAPTYLDPKTGCTYFRSIPRRHPYLYETDEEIEEQETYYDAQYRFYKGQAWQHYTESDWKDAFSDIPKAKPTGLDATEVKRGTSFLRVLTAAGYAPARVSEGRYKIKCPFHNEKSSSCFIYTEDNHYHCYGCQAHGDVLSFIQQAHHATFKEALEIAAYFM
jgi:hypothetical protein